MARIKNYINDRNVTADDLLVGSSFEGNGISGPIYKTRNYKLEDVIAFFRDYIGLDVEGINAIVARLVEIESQFTLENGDITGLNTTEVIYQSADRRATLAFTTSTFEADPEVINGSSMYYFDFTHNLSKYPSIMVTESGSPDQLCMVPIKYIDNNTVRVYFRSKTSGNVYAN